MTPLFLLERGCGRVPKKGNDDACNEISKKSRLRNKSLQLPTGNIDKTWHSRTQNPI